MTNLLSVITHSKVIKLWPLLLPLILIIPGLSGFPYPSNDALYSDLTITHYPYALFLKRSILNQGGIPHWSPLILSGHPFITNPLSGIWYPPGWLIILLPIPMGFNLLVSIHLLWGGVGMYYLLRSEQISHRAAIIGALAFGFLPKLFSHYGAGHLTLLYAVPWTPWLLLASRQGKRDSVKPGIVLAMIILADIRWTVYSLSLWWIYCVINHKGFSHKDFRKISFSNRNRWSRMTKFRQIVIDRIKRFKFPIFHLMTNTILAVCITTPLLLPLYEFTSLSTRAYLSPQDLLKNSLPPARLLGLFYPDFGGYHEWIFYPGAVVLILSVFSIIKLGSSIQKRFWILAAALSLLFSLGNSLPLVHLIVKLPGFNLLRVPPRFLFLFGIATCTLAAHTIHGLMLESLTSQTIRQFIFIMTGLTSFIIMIPLGIWVMTGNLPLNFLYGTISTSVVSLWILLYLLQRIEPRIWVTGLMILGILDWSIVNISLYSWRSKELVLSEQINVVQFLSQREGSFRVYSPSYSIPQQMGALYGLELADGVDPLQLLSYVRFMDAATGVPYNDYSVTLPPFEGGDPSNDNIEYQPDPVKLGLLNVRYLTSEFDLNAEGLVFLDQVGRTRIYENMHSRPRSWVQPLDSEVGEDAEPAEVLELTPRNIRIRAVGPGLLVLSELAYEGWEVYVDGEESELIIVENILRGVNLKSGQHEVIFSYHPQSFNIGLVISGSVLSTLLINFLWKKFKSNRSLHHDINY